MTIVSRILRPRPGSPTGATLADLNRQGRTGRPDFTLEEWAGARGLRFRDQNTQQGFLLATCPWSPRELLFNVCRGELAPGHDGVVCHQAWLMSAAEGGTFYGQAAENSDSKLTTALSFVAPVGSVGVYRVPYTVVGLRLPHLPAVRGLHVARKRERLTQDGGGWSRVDVPPLTAGGWGAAVRDHSDPEIVKRILDGPMTAVLEGRRELGLEVRLEYGQLVVARQQFVSDLGELDALVGLAIRLAESLGPLCAPPDRVTELDLALREPRWVARLREAGGAYTMLPQRVALAKVEQVGRQLGMAVEDPMELHRAFPRLDLAGEAFGVLHGPLPGSGRPGRLISCVERPMDIPAGCERLIAEPGGPTGSDCVVLAAGPGVPETPPGGKLTDAGRLFVRGGVLVLRKMRPRWQMNAEPLRALAARAVALDAP